MKKIAFAMLLLMMSLTASSAWAKTVAINKTNFPDAVFREYVLSNFDTNGDKKLTDAEAKKVKSLYLREEGIASLKGIEYFTALTSLNYRGGKLEHGGQLATLDVSKNTALLELIVECHQLTSLKVSGCTKLNVLHCGENRLTALDVSKIPLWSIWTAEETGCQLLMSAKTRNLFNLNAEQTS